jgi:phosphomevalonate kinase
LSAPGKAFLAGEFAVLEAGRPALVMGIDQRLHAKWDPAREVSLLHQPSGTAWDGGAAPEELRFAVRAAELALRLCAEEGLPRQGFRLVYEDDFGPPGPKPGLGGSAAASVIAVRAACAAQRRALAEAETVALAVAAHWIEQGGAGSGGDVAACALGGVQQVRARIPWQSAGEAMALKASELLQANALESHPVQVPEDLRVLLALTGKPADTRALVREVRHFREGDPRRWTAVAGEIERCAESLRTSLEAAAGDAASERARGEALEAVRAGAAALAKLGEEAGAPIITADLTLACALAASAGAAGKPSGAGGGDCAVILAFGDAVRDRAEAALLAHFPVLRVSPVRVSPA